MVIVIIIIIIPIIVIIMIIIIIVIIIIFIIIIILLLLLLLLLLLFLLLLLLSSSSTCLAIRLIRMDYIAICSKRRHLLITIKNVLSAGKKYVCIIFCYDRIINTSLSM